MIRFFNVYYPTRTVILVLGEALLVFACFLLATFMVLGQDAYIVLNYEFGWLKISGVTLLTLLLSYYFDLYEPQIVFLRREIYFRILLVLGFDCFALSATMHFLPDIAIEQGRVYVVGFALLIPAFLFWRRSYEWIVNQPLFRERVYVLGAGEFARTIIKAIADRPDMGMEVVEWAEISPSEPAERRLIWADALDRVSSLSPPVHRIIVAMESQRSELPIERLMALRFQGITVEEVGTLRERLSGKIQLDGLRPSSFLYSEGFKIRSSQQFTRRVVSMCAAAAGLLILLPFIPIIMLMVKFSSKGPVFFRQTRVGVNGRTFNVIKFRTMFTDAEAEGAKWATKNDPRVTRIGMFMRKTRLDEIPQLWNILRGDMDFVGPRPERPEFIPMLTENLPFYYLRHLVRPGLTGWAQIRYGYGATLAEAREKLEYDLYYLKHMSLGLDLYIMFETIKTIIRRRGAQ
jgi:sugar transferase (PEP-CTERM system associated)